MDIREESESDLNLKIGHERAQRLETLEQHFQRLKIVEGVLGDRVQLEATIARTACLAIALSAFHQAIASQVPLNASVLALRAASKHADPFVQVVACL